MRDAIHEHARVLLERELERRHAALAALPDPRRRVVEAAALRALVAAVTELLEQAAGDSRLAAALASVYVPVETASIVPAGATAG
jgi:hypothetical protein